MRQIVGKRMNSSRSTFPAPRRKGFSLIELMAVLAISAILLAIGVPSFRTMIQKQRITTATNDFFAAIHLARSEAVQRGRRVDLVPTDPGGDWAKGWIVFVDNNNNQRADLGEQVIFTSGAAAHGIVIQAKLTDSSVQYVAYNGTGRTRTNKNSETPQFGTFSFKLDSQNRKIILNMLGRPRLCNPDIDKATC
jgi:type IV fimbrial biogenesis protein FimT